MGRGRELEVMTAELDAVARGRGGLTLIVGEAGIGKTRLLEEGVREAERRGFAWAWGRGWEMGGAPPFWTWIEALRGLARGAGAPAAPKLERAGETERFLLFDDVATYLRRASNVRPVLLVLDDRDGARRDLAHVRGDLLPAVPDDHDRVRGGERFGGREHVAEQRPSGEAVQHLGQGARLHPGALARGENDYGKRGVGHGHLPAATTAALTSVCWLGDSDSNRDCKAPKACGLPITPSPTAAHPDGGMPGQPTGDAWTAARGLLATRP